MNRVMHNTCMKAWKRHQNNVLGRHQSCSEEKIKVLSDSIARNHSSQNTSSLLYSESCQDGNWRSHKREITHATSASTKDLTTSRLDKRIGVLKMPNDQKDKLCNNLEFSNRTNQYQTQIMIERGNPLLEATQGSRQVEENRPVPNRSV